MPENLLEKIFASWFEFAGHTEEIAIEQAVRHSDESSIPGGLGSFINKFWQRRPTRLFSLLANYRLKNPQVWFSFLDDEIKRLPLVLACNYYSQTQLEQLGKLAVKNEEQHLEKRLDRQSSPGPDTSVVSGLSRPAVPLLIDSDNPSHPAVIFDRFSDDFSLFMRLSPESPVIAQHRQVCELFMQKMPTGKLLMPLLPLMCFPFPGFSAEGHSFEMGLWVSLWLAAHNCPQTADICCTGTICRKNGRIGKVSRLDEKLTAALEMGFSTCLVPAENFSASRFAGDHRVVALADIDELNDWLLQNTGTSRQRRRVVSWLQSDRQTPLKRDFAAFFNDTPEIDNAPAAYWKTLLRQQSPGRRLHRLKRLVREYCSNPNAATSQSLAYLPASLRYACLPWLLQEISKDRPAAAESLYLTFSRRCADSTPEIYHASRFIIDKSCFSLLSQAGFVDIRHRFPMLLWLFFREPTEMLLAFSLLKNLNASEKRLLRTLVALLDRHADIYCNNAATARIDSRIMQKLLQQVDSEARFRPGPVLTIRKRLLYLWQASNNFAAAGNKRAVACCQRLLKLHLDFLTARITPGFDLADTFTHSSADGEAMKKMATVPALHDLLHAVTAAKSDPDRCNRHEVSLVNPLKNFKQAIQMKSADLLWLPQPGIAGLRAIRNDSWPELNFFGLLRQFSRNNYRTPATELREACLAFWAGSVSSHYTVTVEQTLQSKAYKHAGNLRLPFLTGWLQQKYSNTKVLPCSDCRKLLTTEKLPADSLIWLLLLPKQCRPCMMPQLLTRLKSADNSVGIERLRCKHDIYLSMLQTLLEPDRENSQRSFWLHELAACDREPSQSRRTVQALAPFYYLLTGNGRQAWRHVKRSRHLVNNSEFTLAFLLRFSRFGNLDFRVQPVPELSQSVEKHLLDSITLGYYHLFKTKLFDSYILNEVEDLANLQIVSH